jgi:nicotinamidase-related amidase
MEDFDMNGSKPDFETSALIVVDAQNDFISADGYFDRMARKHPEAGIDREFLGSVVPNIRRLAEAFRAAARPVVYITHVLEKDYLDACFPYWRMLRDPGPVESQFIVKGTWGAEIVDELKAEAGEKVVVKKGFDGFHRTPLESILRNMGVTTCVMTGVTTCVCVSSTTRGGVERNFRMVFVSDCTAEVHREWHEAELATMDWVYADVMTADEVLDFLG